MTIGHGDESHVVGQAVQCPGLVLDRGSSGKQPFHAVPAGMAFGHDAKQIITAVCRNDLRLVDARQQLDHALGRARIPGVPEVALRGEQLRDRAIDMDSLDSVPGEKMMDRARTSDVLEQDVCSMIVAVDQHTIHQLSNGLPVNGVVQALLAVIDLRQVERGNRHLDRAGHRKRRISLDADAFTRVEVDRGNSDISRCPCEDGAQLLLDRNQVR